MSENVSSVAAAKRLSAALLLLGLASAGLNAEPAAQRQQIEGLQRRVSDLEARIERLEAEIQRGVPVNPAREVQPVPGGWHAAANWGLLVAGQSDYEVEAILGEPQNRKTVSKFEFWEYGDGKLRFYLRRLKSWEMPSAIDDGRSDAAR
jgi:hypothetical protein